jgi:hypothetical protein
MYKLADRRAAYLLIIAGASIALATACSESPSSPQPVSRLRPPQSAPRDDVTECRSGYVMVGGRQVCGD